MTGSIILGHRTTIIQRQSCSRPLANISQREIGALPQRIPGRLGRVPDQRPPTSEDLYELLT